ncbi:MAG: DUF3465 domain-containing protein [Candidatus Eremiobacteraeota bacterium]|nr:DUF3465 domain-containing protein [Candidatus Eremiobacteraeota bacterium]
MKSALGFFVATFLWACASASTAPDNPAALRDMQAGRSGSEVIVEGPVTRVLPMQAGQTGLHERFIVQVRDDGKSMPVLVADNISIAQAAPVHPGDRVIVKGELAFNDLGPVIHWTHRDPRFHHAPGFVKVGGTIYE